MSTQTLFQQWLENLSQRERTRVSIQAGGGPLWLRRGGLVSGRPGQLCAKAVAARIVAATIVTTKGAARTA